MKTNVTSAGLVMALMMVAGAVALFVSEIDAQGRTYEIGERGPAGGWIFYDKGNTSGGWRYLEAAAEDQDRAKWGCFGKSIPGTKDTAIGTGKANTAAIIKSCEEPKFAAKVAADYRGGGKSDWFLPSKDELNLMYNNLHRAGGGGFGGYCYWSSSGDYFANYAWLQNFLNGDQSYHYTYYHDYGVRAIRAF